MNNLSAELITSIDEIIKFGLQANLNIPDRNFVLEKNLVNIYRLYFEVDTEFDEREYNAYDKSMWPDVKRNVESNFRDFEYYKVVLDLYDLNIRDDTAFGDAIDDLTDIIFDLLEVKWRIENNSVNDGFYHFKLIFSFHTQQHIIDLLNYMKQRE